MAEEGDDLVAGGNGRLTLLVNQVGRHHTVRARDNLLEEWRRVSIGGVIWEHPPNEAITERLGIGRKPLSCAEAIARESVADDGQIILDKSLSHFAEFVWRDLESAGVVEWK